MARLRFLAVAVLALALTGNPTQTGRSAGDPPTPGGSTNTIAFTPVATCIKVSAANDGPCAIYALTDMGYDSDLGKWIAQTVPEMIEPKSWQEQGGAGVLRYYAPKNILIVKNSSAIQAKVDGFLKDLKKSLPKGSENSSAAGKKSPRPSIIPADYRTPAPLGTSSPMPGLSSYPVPAPVKAPKHLFHFLIRYEGDGIIDNNVVKFLKAYGDSVKETASKPSSAGGVSPVGAPAAYAPSASPPPPVMPGDNTEPLPAPTSAIEANDTKDKGDKKDSEKVR